MSDKGGKKKKFTKVSLNEFMAAPSVGDWAAEGMGDISLPSGPSLPTAPGEYSSGIGGYSGRTGGYDSGHFPAVDFSKLPGGNGPFIAFIGNLPYDLEESHEITDAIRRELPHLEILRIHLPKTVDVVTGANQFRGFGYVEFADVESLKILLEWNGKLTVHDRRLRFDIAEPSATKHAFSGKASIGHREDRYPRDGFRSSNLYSSRARGEEEANEGAMDISDWRRAAPMHSEPDSISSRAYPGEGSYRRSAEYSSVNSSKERKTLTRRSTPLEMDDVHGASSHSTFRSSMGSSESRDPLEAPTWRRGSTEESSDKQNNEYRSSSYGFDRRSGSIENSSTFEDADWRAARNVGQTPSDSDSVNSRFVSGEARKPTDHTHHSALSSNSFSKPTYSWGSSAESHRRGESFSSASSASFKSQSHRSNNPPTTPSKNYQEGQSSGRLLERRQDTVVPVVPSAASTNYSSTAATASSWRK